MTSPETVLRQRLRAIDRLIVAFSGGVDSTYLLAVATDELGERVTAATAVSPSLPATERAAAARLAADLGAAHVEIATDEAERAAYRRNDLDRCFHCKSALFDALTPIAAAMGPTTIAVGTVTDDLADHRPGQRAAGERGVITPLADAGMSKAEIRRLSRVRGLPTWDKPAAACLASRVAYGLPVTPSRLARIERAEAWLRDAFAVTGNLRVRDHGQRARIEVDLSDVGRLTAAAEQITAALVALGWDAAEIDAAGFRSGSLNPPRASLPSAPPRD